MPDSPFSGEPTPRVNGCFSSTAPHHLNERACSMTTPELPPGESLILESLIMPTPQGIASRILGKAAGGNMTLFAFDEGQGLTEHSSPFDAFVLVLEGVLTL